jgi:hypothetical protein
MSGGSRVYFIFVLFAFLIFYMFEYTGRTFIELVQGTNDFIYIDEMRRNTVMFIFKK